MKFKVIKRPGKMPVRCWAVVSLTEAAVSGFDSPEAAQAWATEWGVSPERCVIAPVVDSGMATAALARFEKHRQGLEGEEWKQG
jgi:hypothetical protein